MRLVNKIVQKLHYFKNIEIFVIFWVVQSDDQSENFGHTYTHTLCFITILAVNPVLRTEFVKYDLKEKSELVQLTKQATK